MKKISLKKTLLLITLVLAMGIALTACGGGGGTPQSVVLNVAHVEPVESETAWALEIFQELVYERSGGAIEVHLFHASALGNERDIAENVNDGSIQMSYLAPGALGGAVFPEISVLDAPFLFRDPQHVSLARTDRTNVLWSEIVAELHENSNHYILDFWYRPPRHFLTTDTPVHTLADLDGLRMRVPEVPITLESLAGIGASVTPIAFAEVYAALQMGVVDGLENPLNLAWGMGFHEVTNYVSLVGWNTGLAPMSIHGPLFHSLSEEHQTIIRDAMIEAGDWHFQETMDNQVELVERFRNYGLAIIEPDLGPFRERAHQIAPDLGHLWNDNGRDFYQRINAIGS
jgi:tripartite ATP-independent transporter DctP family solute receptor